MQRTAAALGCAARPLRRKAKRKRAHAYSYIALHTLLLISSLLLSSLLTPPGPVLSGSVCLPPSEALQPLDPGPGQVMRRMQNSANSTFLENSTVLKAHDAHMLHICAQLSPFRKPDKSEKARSFRSLAVTKAASEGDRPASRSCTSPRVQLQVLHKAWRRLLAFNLLRMTADRADSTTELCIADSPRGQKLFLASLWASSSVFGCKAARRPRR